MGESIYCDSCGASIPQRDLVHEISINGDKIVDVCQLCSQKLRGALNNTRTLIYKNKSAAVLPATTEEPQAPEVQVKTDDEIAAVAAANSQPASQPQVPPFPQGDTSVPAPPSGDAPTSPEGVQ